jgi:threonine dehydrogenase-like Zn-dependent dehydrogenase
MKAVVFHAIGDIRLDDVPEPRLEEPSDAIIRLTASAVCTTDLHFVSGVMPGMKPGTILGHEGVGVVEQLGADVRNLEIGDRVVVCSSIACGACSYCRAGYFAQCDRANPNGRRSGTACFGGPEDTGPFNGLHAERARIPFANVGLVKLPDEVTDDQAILLSDIFPTGYFGCELARIARGDSVAVFGCNPVGQFAIASALLAGAGRVLAIDKHADRLAVARRQGAETINPEEEDPVSTVLRLTGDIGVDCVIDAAGADAMDVYRMRADHKLPVGASAGQRRRFAQDPGTGERAHQPSGAQAPRAASTEVHRWAVECAAKGGTLGIIGVYPIQPACFPLGIALRRNLAVNGGACHHRRYIPKLVRMVRSGVIDPVAILSKNQPIHTALDAYEAFDQLESGWLQVELIPRLAAE